MSKTFDQKIEEIMHALHARGFMIKGIRNGIRVKMGSGMDVDIYTLKSDTDHIRGRIRTDVEAEAVRTGALADITEQLRQGLDDKAELEDFRLTRQENGVFTYYTRIFFGVDDIFIFEQESGPQLKITPESTSISKSDAARGSDLENAVVLLESVDPKTFRKSLDDLGLSRSSLLRVVLSRLFRAAVDLDELETAIREEAERITDPQDRMALEQIRAFNTIEFLDPLIRMLYRQAIAGDSDLELRMA